MEKTIALRPASVVCWMSNPATAGPHNGLLSVLIAIGTVATLSTCVVPITCIKITNYFVYFYPIAKPSPTPKQA
jgi:hypothetical protein